MNRPTSSTKDYAYFQISIKVLISQKDKYLILTTPDNYIDFPGGRVDNDEVELSFIDCLNREVKEECGPNFKLKINNVIFCSKRRYTKNKLTHNILALFYSADYLSGDLQLSDEHSKFSWLSLNDLRNNKNNFMSIDEYEQIYQYYDGLDNLLPLQNLKNTTTN